ncbi:hypothetical protein LEP48_10105 [Isoptericola sp. NEAU-Y5]|uniref:Uncharacterized protein n=1 Tax=Isoptericola luteus TaxID=2879484 RepID=A0ABS7ZF96_9MICO|nr:hypothetical protein [Isoptericola sp. NEAU-Y5]
MPKALAERHADGSRGPVEGPDDAPGPGCDGPRRPGCAGGGDDGLADGALPRPAPGSGDRWIGVSRPVSSRPRMPPVADGGRTTGADAPYDGSGDCSRSDRRDGGGAAGGCAAGAP